MKRFLVILFVIIFTALIVLIGVSCKGVDWPSGTGYVTPATNRPLSPYQIQTNSTNWEILGINENGDFIWQGIFEVYGNKSSRWAPGAVITNHNIGSRGVALTLIDCNGDKCIIPYGMTVRINEYGQYVPVRYDPELPPAE